MHLKRLNMGKSWPIPRKGTKYLTVSSHNKKSSIPLMVVMRDILKAVRTKKELKYALNEKQIKVNEKKIKDTNYPISFFDVISIKNKNYRSSLSENGKIIFEEISDNESVRKIIKIIGKKVLKDKIIQFNLSDGRNFISKEKAKINDSVLFNFNKGIEKIIRMEKDNEVFVIKGKHAGISGKIEEIIERGGKKLIVIKSNNQKINIWIKNVIAIK